MAMIQTTSTAALVFNDELDLCSDSDGGLSSGYDSGDVYESESDANEDDHHPTEEVNSDDTDDDCYQDSVYDSDSESDDDDENDEEDTRRYTNTKSLSESLKYILSLPELCDVTFHVGSEKVPIYGVKAICGTRSRVLYSMILKAEKEKQPKKRTGYKKFRKSKSSNQNPVVQIDNYETEVFRKIIQFIHSGCVEVDSSSVVGLLYGADQFDLRDLRSACWDYFEKMDIGQSGVLPPQMINSLKQCPDKTLQSAILSSLKKNKERRQQCWRSEKRETIV